MALTPSQTWCTWSSNLQKPHTTGSTSTNFAHYLYETLASMSSSCSNVMLLVWF